MIHLRGFRHERVQPVAESSKKFEDVEKNLYFCSQMNLWILWLREVLAEFAEVVGGVEEFVGVDVA